MKVLITGVNGFAGSHLAEYLLGEGLEISGTVLHADHIDNIAPFSDKIRLYEADIRDTDSLREIIEKENPQQIYHLAGLSSVRESWNDPKSVYEINFIGTFNLYEAIAKSGISTRLLFASSMEVYGSVHMGMLPIREDLPLRPASPYAVSKASAELLIWQYSYYGRLEILCTRAFNHIGPRQEDKFVCSNFGRQIAEIESGKREPVIRVGNLEAKRDFTDVRDMVRAYRAVMEKGTPGEVYNVCSGDLYSIKSILDMMLTMSEVKIEIKVDETRLRPIDIPAVEGDNSKVTSLGWTKRIPIDKSLEDILNYWRRVIRKS